MARRRRRQQPDHLIPAQIPSQLTDPARGRVRRVLWDSLHGYAKVLTSVGSAIVVMAAGWHWVGTQVVWAEQFNRQMNQIDCRFARIERVQLEGYAADMQYKISTYNKRKSISVDEARELAQLSVRLTSIQRQLSTLPDCSQIQPQSQQPR